MIRAVVGILQREDKVLIGQRPIGKSYAGYWEFPGGKIEPNESSNAALKRELDEELGIEVISAEPWFEHTHAYPDCTVFLELWRVQAFSGEPQGKEKQALCWATISEISTLRLLEGNLVILEKMKALLM